MAYGALPQGQGVRALGPSARDCNHTLRGRALGTRCAWSGRLVTYVRTSCVRARLQWWARTHTDTHTDTQTDTDTDTPTNTHTHSHTQTHSVSHTHTHTHTNTHTHTHGRAEIDRQSRPQGELRTSEHHCLTPRPTRPSPQLCTHTSAFEASHAQSHTRPNAVVEIIQTRASISIHTLHYLSRNSAQTCTTTQSGARSHSHATMSPLEPTAAWARPAWHTTRVRTMPRTCGTR